MRYLLALYEGDEEDEVPLLHQVAEDGSEARPHESPTPSDDDASISSAATNVSVHSPTGETAGMHVNESSLESALTRSNAPSVSSGRAEEVGETIPGSSGYHGVLLCFILTTVVFACYVWLFTATVSLLAFFAWV